MPSTWCRPVSLLTQYLHWQIHACHIWRFAAPWPHCRLPAMAAVFQAPWLYPVAGPTYSLYGPAEYTTPALDEWTWKSPPAMPPSGPAKWFRYPVPPTKRPGSVPDNLPAIRAYPPSRNRRFPVPREYHGQPWHPVAARPGHHRSTHVTRYGIQNDRKFP